jgi:hypothetical protein
MVEGILLTYTMLRVIAVLGPRCVWMAKRDI